VKKRLIVVALRRCATLPNFGVINGFEELHQLGDIRMFLLHRGGRQGENNNCINIISYTVKPFGSLYEKSEISPAIANLIKMLTTTM